MRRHASIPKKYEHIDFTPPKGVADAAAKGLELRQKASPSNRGGLTPSEASKQGIGSGVQRAVNLKNRDTVSPKVIKQMRGFLSRSEKSSTISPENKGTPWNDKGYVAWLLWGGDPAKAWVAKVIKQMEAADEKEKQKTAYFSEVQESGGIKVLPQGQWEIVSWSEMSDYMRDSVWDVYDVSYGTIGKHVPNKEVFGKKYQYLYMIDVDDDILPDAFIAYKTTHAGFKIALGGTDGTRKAKKAMILKMKELIRQPGWYAEASHKVSAILESAGARPIDDEEVVRKTLKGKQIEWLGDGKYSRQLGKSNISAAKSLYGTPRVAMQVRVARRVMASGLAVERRASDNEPTNPGLWAKVQALTKGEKTSITVNGKKINGPNEGKGFTVFPCVPVDGSEALTRQGWRSYEELHVGDEIVTYNKDSDCLEWGEIRHLHHHKEAPVIRLHKAATCFDFVCTADHKWVIKQSPRTGSVYKPRARKYPDQLVSADQITQNMKVITSAVMADSDPVPLCGFRKHAWSWVGRVLAMSHEQREAWLASAIVYDGHEIGYSERYGRCSYGFSQKDPDHAEATAICAVLLGYNVSFRKKKHNPSMMSYTFIDRRTHSTGNVIKEDAGVADVWCPQTDNQTWVMRQRRMVTITGNSAYANGWASKTYKDLGGGWKKKASSADGFMSDYRSMTFDNFLDPRSRVWSYATSDGERLPLIMTEIGPTPNHHAPIWLKAIVSPERQGTGQASTILRKITDLADKHGVAIWLTPKPFGNIENALSASKLKGWYKRYGWEPAGGDVWVRQPAGVSRTARGKTYKDLGGKWKKKAGPKSWRSEITPGSPAEDCDAMVSTAWVSPQGKMVFLRGQTHEGFAEKWALRNEPGLHAQIVEYGQNARPHASIWHRVMLDRGWLQLQGLSSIVVPPRPSRKQLENVANFFAGCIADGTNNPDLITLRIIGLHPSLRGKPIEPGEDMYPFDVQERVILSDFIEREASGPVIEDMYESMMERTRRASLIEAWGPTLRAARGKAKKDVGHGGLDEWFSGHGGAKGKGEDATWGDWVSISPVTKTLPSGKKVEKGEIVGECGISDDPDWKEITKGGEDPLKCMPRQKAHDMPKAERAEKAKAKQKAEQADSSRGKKPTMTPTFQKEKGKKKASSIDRVFRSPEPFTGFRPVSGQKVGFKPEGLWYSCGSEWDDWCRYEMPHWITGSPYVYRIEVNLSRMLVIRNDDDFRDFDARYRIFKSGFGLIDWPRVARDYDGIEICPYQQQHRMSSGWYYSWGVASGCIWGSGAFKSVEPVETCGVEKSATVQRIQMKREASARLRAAWRGNRG